MFNKKKKFYITTSIAYANAPPHIGFALELVQADVLARCHRSLGEDVFFLTGTDEHGIKIVKASEEAGYKDPQKFVDNISSEFEKLTKELNISNNDFIRTTDKKKHWPVVSEIWNKLDKKRDIYERDYEGYYCAGCEAYITEKTKNLLLGGCSIHHNLKPVLVKEKNYFFKLSKYGEEIKKLIEKDEIEIIPKTRKNEILSFVKQGLEDISFSRAKENLKWGIPVPGDDSQTIYVWSDALVNYISALEYPKGNNFKKYWPADIHCIGKDILKFHTLIWPAMLLSLGIGLPKVIFVHGFITVDGQKMSKSLGNVIDPFELVEKYGTDSVRYYLLREISPTEDGDFTYEKFEARYNSDLAGGIGNLVARLLGIAGNIEINKLKPTKKTNEKIEKTKKDYALAITSFRFNEALAVVWELISYCDKYINDEKLWETKKPEAINDLFYTLNEISDLLSPFLPETAEKIKKAIESKKSEILFPKIYPVK